MSVKINGESHRNPSGTINKASWLLSNSKRDIKALASLYMRCGYPPHAFVADKQSRKYQSSWEAAYVMAQYCIEHNVSKPSDVFNSINFDFEKGSTLKQGDIQWYEVLSDYFVSLVFPVLKETHSVLWMVRPGLVTLYNMFAAYVKSGKIKSDGLTFPMEAK